MSLTQNEFESLRQQAQDSRTTIESTALSLQAEMANMQRIERELAVEQSKAEPDAAVLDSLNQDLVAANDTIHTLQSQYTIRQDGLKETVRQLVVYDDPRFMVNRLDDRKPVFLFPVRVETRFMTVKHIHRIRAKTYPPGEAPIIGEVAVKETRAVEAVMPTQNQLPIVDDKQELWVRIFPDDIAVHTHEKPLTPDEQTAGETYWTEMWYAGDDENLELGAWRGLTAGRGPERSAWVARETKPTNASSKPTSPVPKEDPLPTSPIFPTPILKTDAWTEAPRSKVMPDCFVIRLYNGTSWREVVGNPIPDPLVLGFDPNSDELDYDFENGKYETPQEIRWMTDFDEAVKVGMAMRVELNGNEHVEGFDRVLVLGVKYSSNETEGKALLEELMDNHHYTDGGLSILPQGTPTNNTEDGRSGYTIFGPDEKEIFLVEQGPELFSIETDDRIKTDGQHLAEALGLDYSVFQHINFANHTDIKDAMCMNRALFCGTLGYYLKQILHPAIPDADIERTRTHFNQFVLGRGRIPAIRVEDQPYGILPVTAYSRWKEDRTDAQANYRKGLYNNILVQMDGIWTGLVDLVKHAEINNPDLDPKELFMEVLGLHASSVEFYQRFSGGPFFMWNLYNFHSRLNSQQVQEVPYEGGTDYAMAFSNWNFSWLAAPRIFGFGYLGEQRYLNGPVIDSLPLSEQRVVEKISGGNENYIKWLQMSNYNTILAENYSNVGANGASPPNALLYLLLRHAALHCYVRSGLNILVSAELYPAEAAIESELVNIVETNQLTMETRELVGTFVEVELGVPREADLTSQTEAEFAFRESQGQLEDLTVEQINAEKVAFKNNLRMETEGAFREQVTNETAVRLERFETVRSRTGMLSEVYPEVTLDRTLEQHLAVLLDENDPKVADMKNMRDALNCLSGMGTARLERAFAEHIDLLNYRLDAWFQSLVLERIHELRLGGSERDTGLYLGSYSWLENLRPSGNPGIVVEEVDMEKPTVGFIGVEDPYPAIDNTVKATPQEPVYYRRSGARAEVEVAEANIRDVLNVSVANLGPRFSYLGTGSSQGIVYDPASDKFVMAPQVNTDNQGYIHAPSLNHASTAAILRAGYNSHSENSGSAADALAVNLTSERVRRALHLIEGIRNGQELSALLGYLFERAMHDDSEDLDEFLLEFRNEFPLVANRVVESSGSGTSVTNADEGEAYNVADGLKLVEASTDPYLDYPYGVTFTSPNIPNTAEANAIKDIVAMLHETLDATNDLLLAESVYQTVQGNPSGAGASLDALSGKAAPVNPEILRTPRSRKTLTHRVTVMFDTASGGDIAWSASSSSARSLAEPHLNRWLGTMLPQADKIRIAVEYRALSAAETDPWTSSHVLVNQLDLQAIDFFHLLSNPSKEGEAVELVNRVAFYVRKHIANTDDVAVKVLLTDKSAHTATQYSVYELTPIVLQLAQVVNSAKPLQAEDVILPSEVDEKVEANPTAGYDTTNLEARLMDVLTTGNMTNGEYGLGKVVSELTGKITPVENLDYNSLPGNEAVLLEDLRSAVMAAAAFSPRNGIPASSTDFSEDNARAMVKLASRVKIELNARLLKANDMMTNLSSDVPTKVKQLGEVAKVIFGRSFKVFPEFTYYDPSGFEAARINSDYLDHAGTLAVDEWMQGAAMVRKKLGSYQKAQLYSSAVLGIDAQALRVAQFPIVAGGDNYWLGVEYPDTHEVPNDNLSLVIEYPSSAYNNGANVLRAGFIMDEWVEDLPESEATTGIAIHYDNPNSEPPQTCLLAITPEITGSWSWDDLMQTLNETLDWAKKRAVDPDIISTTPLAQVLPMTMASLSGSGDSPSLDYGRNVVITPPGLVTPLDLEQFESIHTVQNSN
jgi:hypothetical protein